MTYYDSLAEDVARAKAILDEGRPSERDLAGLPPLMRESLSASGGTIFGKDTYAAYKLLESFVDVIEALGVEVCATALRAQQTTEER